MKFFYQLLHRTIIVITLLVLAPASLAAVEDNQITFTPELRQLLDSLDSTLAMNPSFINSKRIRINNLRNSVRHTKNVEQQYWFYHDLYDEYRIFDSDSAIYYTNKCSEIAEALGRENWLDEMNIYRIYLYAATGLLDGAQKSVDAIDESRLSNEMLIPYYQNLLFLHTHRDTYLGSVSTTIPYTEKTQKLLADLASHIPPTEPSYPWFFGWRSLGDVDSAATAISRLKLL